jgi:hypothetical protein
MTTRSFLTLVAGAALFVLASAAHAQATATFTNQDDSSAGVGYPYTVPEYFDVRRSTLAADDPNTLNIGLDGTYGFRVGSVASGCCSVTQLPSLAYDTVSFRVTAPEGTFLTAVILNINATTMSDRFGSSRFTSSGAVDGNTMALASGRPTVFDLVGQQKTSVIVTLNAMLTSTGNRAGLVTSASASALFAP